MEVVIAIAIFAILIGPITSALISAVKTGTTSTKKQYAVEKAEEIMENFKTANLSGDVSIVDGNTAASGTGSKYTFTKGTAQTKTLSMPVTLGDGSTSVSYTSYTYTCNDVSIGTNFEKYNCSVEVNDAAYQVMKQGYILTGIDESGNAVLKEDGSGYVKTNSSSTGTIRNLDSKQSAIITGATYTGSGSTAAENNLDNQAAQYFTDTKRNLLRNYPAWYNQYQAGDDMFSEDQFSKNTTIEITKTGTVYTVRCKVKYTDTVKRAGIIKSAYETNGVNEYEPSTAYGVGVVYEQTFDGELPPIYLLYSPGICNGRYCDVDTITIDNKTLTTGDSEAEIYIFEYAADSSIDKYADVIKDQIGLDVDKLKYTSSTSYKKIGDVDVHLNFDTTTNSRKLISVYTNFNATTTETDLVKTLDEDDDGSTYMYDINVTLKSGSGNETVVTGTRGQ